ncbi:MAG: ROK family protein [Armatimonadota bacterium]|nr:ROK family protein [Armatimonadota bacterium]
MANNFITVDVGGTKILAAVVTDSGAILARHKDRTERGSKKKLVEQIQNAIATVVATANLPQNSIYGIALGVPGVVDTATGHVVFTPNAPLSDTPLATLISQRFGVPTVVNNDVNLGVLGECWLGVGRDVQSAFGIFVGTGIGGGLVIDGKLIEGFRGLGGEVGHLMVPLGADEIEGMLTHKHLFLEDLCSRTAIENQLRHAILKEGKKSVLKEIVDDPDLKRIRSRALRQALRQNDPLVTDVIKRASYLLGLATASVLHIVDPEIMIFGGGVIEACGDWMLPLIEKTTHKVAMQGTGKKVKIVRSTLGDDAIILGGLALLRTHAAVQSATPTVPLLNISANTSERPVAQVDKPLGGSEKHG